MRAGWGWWEEIIPGLLYRNAFDIILFGAAATKKKWEGNLSTERVVSKKIRRKIKGDGKKYGKAKICNGRAQLSTRQHNVNRQEVREEGNDGKNEESDGWSGQQRDSSITHLNRW